MSWHNWPSTEVIYFRGARRVWWWFVCALCPKHSGSSVVHSAKAPQHAAWSARCIVPDEHFHMIFKSHLEERLEADFAPTYNIQLLSFEESLRFLPEAVHQDRKEDELILDWDTNAKGLEQLFIICIGFDAQITGDTDNFTRARLYHAMTRA